MPNREPAVWVGIAFSALLAVVQSLAGNGIIGQDVADTLAKALDPTQGGWLIPVLVGLVTRFFVSPAIPAFTKPDPDDPTLDTRGPDDRQP